MMEFYPGLKGDSIIFCLAVINRNCMKQSVYPNINKLTHIIAHPSAYAVPSFVVLSYATLLRRDQSVIHIKKSNSVPVLVPLPFFSDGW